MPAWIGPIAALAAQMLDPSVCSANLCFADALAPVLAALDSRAEDDRPVHILQIGDSHTAGDMITGAWRRRLQARHGHGGRGVLAAGRPYAGYLTWGVTAAQSGGWHANASFGSRFAADGAPLGLAGFTQTGHARGETLSLAADAPVEAFDRIIVCAIARPGGGGVTLRIGEVQQYWSLDAESLVPECRTLDSDRPALAASITIADEGMVSITSLGAFRRAGGVVLSNLGVVGAQLVHFGRTSDSAIAAELAAYRPDLIVLAFGTNEGFSASLSPDDYEAALRAQVYRIRRLAHHEVPILLLGAPDAASRQPARAGAACGGGWRVPRLLGTVRERQRAVARDMGLGFWDWSAAMGGRCASALWRRLGLMRPDHVHFTREGGDRIGAMIDADLARAAGAPH